MRALEERRPREAAGGRERRASVAREQRRPEMTAQEEESGAHLCRPPSLRAQTPQARSREGVGARVACASPLRGRVPSTAPPRQLPGAQQGGLLALLARLARMARIGARSELTLPAQIAKAGAVAITIVFCVIAAGPVAIGIGCMWGQPWGASSVDRGVGEAGPKTDRWSARTVVDQRFSRNGDQGRTRVSATPCGLPAPVRRAARGGEPVPSLPLRPCS